MTTAEEDVLSEDELELSEPSETSIVVKQIAISGILGALSLVGFSPIASWIPRYAGIALIDPISFCWIIAFLIGGIKVGLLTTFAGSIGLFYFDPYTPVGPIFKILATLPMILIPWIGMRLRNPDAGGEFLGSVKEFAVLMFLAYLVRLGIMIPLNLAVAPIFFPEMDAVLIIMNALILNTSQSALDAIGSFLIVHSSSLFKHFGMW
jgi:hypothetical protein